MPGITTQINNYNNDNFLIRFSNFPNLTNKKDIDMHVFNNYVQNINIPDISIPMLTSVFGHERQIHPNTIGSRDLQTINLQFKIDEKMFNWYAMYCWLWGMRHGQTCGRTSLKGEELVRMDAIDCIEICMLNNDKEIISKLKFHHCILNNLSSLELKYGESETASFICTFEVENMSFDLETKEE